MWSAESAPTFELLLYHKNAFLLFKSHGNVPARSHRHGTCIPAPSRPPLVDLLCPPTGPEPTLTPKPQPVLATCPVKVVSVPLTFTSCLHK